MSVDECAKGAQSANKGLYMRKHRMKDTESALKKGERMFLRGG